MGSITKNDSITGYNSGGAPPSRQLPKLLLRIFAVIVGLCIISGIAFWLRHIYLHTYVYIHKHTDIFCVDSTTGAPVPIEVKILKDGGLDDDWDAAYSIGIIEGVKIDADRNIWVIFEVTAPGYQTAQLKLDEHSPETMTLKMVRAAVTK